MSLSETEAGIITVLASTSSLFTFFLAAFFPSNNGDKFTLSKLVAVAISIFGLVSY
jgi:solute carrier family 35 protein F5